MKIKDDLGRLVKFSKVPERIVSFVPSITEFLFDIGLEKYLVGRTDFCIHPKEKVKLLKTLGGTKNIKIDEVRALSPDLLIAVKEENNKEQIEILANEFPCLVFDITDLESAVRMMQKLAEVLKKEELVEQLVSEIQSEKQKKNINNDTKRAVYLIWHKPMMSINSETYISEMMRYAGFENVFGNKTEAYPVIEDKDIMDVDPEYILLSTEPFAFKEKHVLFYQDKFPNSKVIIVDGEMFSWYGSRIIKAFKYFTNNY